MLGSVFAIGCMQPRPAEPLPITTSLADTEAELFNTDVVALRTMLGRAGIGLEARGTATMLETARCADNRPGCVRCELAGEATPRDEAALAAITTAFARYPTRVLDAAGIEHVALCRRIVQTIGPTDPMGLSDLEDHRMLISFAWFGDAPSIADTAETIVHHELYHLLEWKRTPEVEDFDVEWTRTNPIGFVYAPHDPGGKRELGFVNSYAETNPVEDRASTFELLMADPDQLCAIAVADPIVRAKTRILWRRVAEIDGDDFLRERAQCVDWIDETSAGGGLVLRAPR